MSLGPDVEKAAGEASAGAGGNMDTNYSTTPVLTQTARTTTRHARPKCDKDGGDAETTTIADRDTDPDDRPALKTMDTVLSTRSQREAARTLESFETSPHNPRNWSNARKWRTTLTVAVTGFISTCGSSIAVPGIHAAMAEFGVASEKVGVMITSAYVLGLGAGPFLFAPISELYGRQVAYHSSQGCYVLFSLATAVAPNMHGLIVLRFFCGVFASVGPALGVATCADVFPPNKRGRPVSIYALGPMAGPVLGGMLGYWILYGGWRWLLWSITLMAAANWILLYCLTQETFASVIQKKLQYRVQHPQADVTSWAGRFSPKRKLHDMGWMKAMVSRHDARDVFGRAFSRPPRLLLTNPVAFAFAWYYAYLYGIIYVFLIGVPIAFGRPPFKYHDLFSYEWGPGVLSLSYLGTTVGFGLSALTAATQQDRIYRRLSQKYKDDGQPEYRLVLTQIGMTIMPIGLFIFGWTVRPDIHWIAPQIGMAVVAYGLMLAFNSIQGYIVDAFFPYSAAAIGAATAMRSIVACVLPIFCPQMFGKLGWGWGGTLLALVALLGVPAPLIMFKYGRYLRERFQFHG